MLLVRQLQNDPDEIIRLVGTPVELRDAELDRLGTVVKQVSGELLASVEGGPALSPPDTTMANSIWSGSLNPIKNDIKLPVTADGWNTLKNSILHITTGLTKLCDDLSRVARSYFEISKDGSTPIGEKERISVRCNSGFLFTPHQIGAVTIKISRVVENSSVETAELVKLSKLS